MKLIETEQGKAVLLDGPADDEFMWHAMSRLINFHEDSLDYVLSTFANEDEDVKKMNEETDRDIAECVAIQQSLFPGRY